MLADAGDDDACALTAGLGHHDVGHEGGVGIVEMRDGLVGQDEVEGLHQGAHHGHTLLLAERHQAHAGVLLVADAEHGEPLLNLPARLMAGELVLDFHVLHGRQLGKEAQLLEQQRDIALADGYPLGGAKTLDVGIVEQDLSAEIVAVALYVAAEGALALAAVGLYEIHFAFLEEDVMLPDAGIELPGGAEHLGHDVVESDGIHFVCCNVLS